MRHLVTSDGETAAYGSATNVQVNGGICETSSDASFDTHANDFNWTFNNCKSVGSRGAGFQSRSYHTEFFDCISDGDGIGYLFAGHTGRNLIRGGIIRNTRIRSNLDHTLPARSTIYTGWGVRTDKAYPYGGITSVSGQAYSGAAHYTSTDGLVIDGVKFQNIALTGVKIFNGNRQDLTIKHCEFLNMGTGLGASTGGVDGVSMTPANDDKVAIRIGAQVTKAYIYDNDVRDDATAPGTTLGLLQIAITTATQIFLDENRAHGSIPLLRLASNSNQAGINLDYLTRNEQGNPTAMAKRLSGWYTGAPTASLVLLRFVADRPFTLPTNLAGSVMKASTAAAATTAFSLAKNGGAAFGTITFAAASTIPTYTGTSTSFVVGDVLTIMAPASPDAALADLAFVLREV